MSGLVWVGKVLEVSPIDGADRIESLEVMCGKGGKWRGTAQKGQFQPRDLCRVYLQDSILPPTSEFDFMEKHHRRVRMMRFKGVPSEVLIMPVPPCFESEIGQDITDWAKVEKYEKPIPANMKGETLGSFPSFIPKTDEQHFQDVPRIVEWMQGKKFYSTVKVDGTSCTIFEHEGQFGCCSRNLMKKDTPENAIWQIAREYRLHEVLQGTGLALQFELAGPGIQKNPMGLKKPTPFLFNVYDIEERFYWSLDNIVDVLDSLSLPMVEVIDRDKVFDFPDSESLRVYAEGTYHNGRQREGVVIRPVEESVLYGERVSFKVINLRYKEG